MVFFNNNNKILRFSDHSYFSKSLNFIKCRNNILILSSKWSIFRIFFENMLPSMFFHFRLSCLIKHVSIIFPFPGLENRTVLFFKHALNICQSQNQETYGVIQNAKELAWESCHCRYLRICTLMISPSPIDSAARASKLIRFTPLSSLLAKVGL